MDWSDMAEWLKRPATFEYNLEQRRKVEVALAARNAAEAAATATVAVPVVPTEPVVVVAPPVDPVTALEAALAAAADDTERARLLAAASPKTRELLWARSTYRKLRVDTDAAIAAERAAHVEFSARLDLAEDDAARLAIIRSEPPEFVQRWRFARADTEAAARRRYLAAAGGESVDAA